MFGAAQPADLTRPGALKHYWRAGQTLLVDYDGARLAVTVLGAI